MEAPLRAASAGVFAGALTLACLVLGVLGAGGGTAGALEVPDLTTTTTLALPSLDSTLDSVLEPVPTTLPATGLPLVDDALPLQEGDGTQLPDVGSGLDDTLGGLDPNLDLGLPTDTTLPGGLPALPTTLVPDVLVGTPTSDGAGTRDGGSRSSSTAVAGHGDVADGDDAAAQAAARRARLAGNVRDDGDEGAFGSFGRLARDAWPIMLVTASLLAVGFVVRSWVLERIRARYPSRD